MPQPAPPSAPPGPVAERFERYPCAVRERLLQLRALLLATAAETAGVGAIEETLKWDEPAYRTTQTGSGSTVRLGWKPARPAQVALYFHCRTTLVETFRQQFPQDFGFEGRRALLLPDTGPWPEAALRQCLATALTYHRQRGRQAPGHRGTRPPWARTP